MTQVRSWGCFHRYVLTKVENILGAETIVLLEPEMVHLYHVSMKLYSVMTFDPRILIDPAVSKSKVNFRKIRKYHWQPYSCLQIGYQRNSGINTERAD